MKRCFILLWMTLVCVSIRCEEIDQSNIANEHEEMMSQQEVAASNQELPEFSNMEKTNESEMPIDENDNQPAMQEHNEESALDQEHQLEPGVVEMVVPETINEQIKETPMVVAPETPVAVSEPTELEKMPIPDTQVEIDTTTLENPQGNWLLKRMWWDRAEESYEKLKNLIEDVVDKRVDFFKQRSTLDKDLFDTFYLELGMGFGEFSAIVYDLLDRLEQEQVVNEGEKEKQQNLLDTIRLEKVTIEHVKVNIDDLKKLDDALEDALGIVIETVNKARQYERDGWNFFKEISRLLDDKKARELFYRLDVALQNIKQLNSYLSQAFASYFSNLETRARTTVATLNNQLAELKEKGIDLRKKVENFEQEEKKEQPAETASIEEEEEERKPTSWWKRTVDTVKSLFGF